MAAIVKGQVLRERLASEQFRAQAVLGRVLPDERPLAYYGFLAGLRGRARVVVRYDGEATR